MAGNRFLQSFCAVAASSVLVCGTLLLLNSTAPWTPPDIVSEPFTPDAPRVFAGAESALAAGGEAVALEVPERQAALHVEDAARSYTSSIQRLQDVEERHQPVGASDESVVALGLPLSPETADGPANAGTAIAWEDAAPEMGQAQTASEPVDATPSEPLSPVAPEKIALATDQIADLLSTLPPRVFASDQSEAATKHVAEALAALPPLPQPVIAAEKTGTARDEVASIMAELPPAPTVTVAAELAPAAKPEGLAGGIKVAPWNARAVTLASFAPWTPAEAKTAVEMPVAPEPVNVVASASAPPSLPQPAETALAVEMPAAQVETPPAPKVAALSAAGVTDASPPPPLPRRKPEFASPKLAELAPAAEAEAAAKAQAVSPPRERQAASDTSKQQVAQGGGLFGLFKGGNAAKPMALAPADKPVAAPKMSVTRPSSGAYASQVWARLARHKPRAAARGSASVSFAIGANGSLGAVRIARSSGNSRIDRLALQTVRNAAPFPAPPSGAVSYTIRIDF